VPGVERVVRAAEDNEYEFVINHSAQPCSVELSDGGYDLIRATPVGTRMALAAKGVAIVRRGRRRDTSA
jgi:beta-galactosidase GanA